MARQLGQFKEWPATGIGLTPSEVVHLYDSGFCGAWADPEAKTELQETINAEGGYPFAADVVNRFGLAGTGAGKLVAPFLHVQKMYPNCWPGSAQTRGDCVSHGTRNACLVTLVCELVAGQPDQVSGKVEGPPEVSEAGKSDGVLSSESVYWWRRHGGDGWSCAAAANVVLKDSGCCWPRRNYSELNVDLSTYSGKTAGLYGAKTPPENFGAVGKAHLIRTSTEANSFEQVRDLLANGYGVSSCGGEGFSSTRDECGVSPRRGSWSHAMAYIAADDRDVVKSKYGGPLVLILNSWGPSWNSGPRKIVDTEFEIPNGSFWARWSDCTRRDQYAFSGVNGWPPQKLPNYGFTFLN